MKIARHCPALQIVRLGRCYKVTDASVMKIAALCPLLHTITLNGCRQISDTSILHLARYDVSSRIMASPPLMHTVTQIMQASETSGPRQYEPSQSTRARGAQEGLPQTLHQDEALSVSCLDLNRKKKEKKAYPQQHPQGSDPGKVFYWFTLRPVVGQR